MLSRQRLAFISFNNSYKNSAKYILLYTVSDMIFRDETLVNVVLVLKVASRISAFEDYQTGSSRMFL